MKRVLLLLLLVAGLLRASDIVVVSMAVGADYKTAVAAGIENKQAYCDQHGYDFVFTDQQLDLSRPIAWSKIPLILQVMDDPTCEWIFWTDADSLIMNMAIPVGNLIDDRYNLIISRDDGADTISTGQFLIRNCQWSRDLLQDAYAHMELINHPYWEQEAVKTVLQNNPALWNSVKLIPHRLINSYPVWRALYQPGDFIVHFAGCRNLSELANYFKSYGPQVVNDWDLMSLDHYLGIYGFQLSPLHSSRNEGYLTAAQQKQFCDLLQQHPEIETVVEIGLNGGHSANTFFHCCPNLQRFISFDICTHPYTLPAASYFTFRYQDAFQLVPGDSSKTIPQYATNHPGETADLIYIDGNHSYQGCLRDIINCRALAHANTVLWVDDWFMDTIRQAVYECVANGYLAIDAIHESHDPCGGRSWVEAHYLGL